MFRLDFISKVRTRIELWTARRGPRPFATLVLALSFSIQSYAQVITYEATVFPEQLGWERLTGGNPERSLENGWFIQTFREESQDFYRYDMSGISEFAGRFFVEWRAMSNYPAWLIDEWQNPAGVAAGGNAGVLYHVQMTESAAVFLRDIFIPRVIVPISVGELHTYRVDVYADEYVWYIDGIVVDSGVPEGLYPDPNASITLGSRRNGIEAATTAWDFVRFGRIPEDASGDFDSDTAVTLDDFYFFHECLTNQRPGINGGPGKDAGPGCRFADFDFDTDVDLFDFAEFQLNFSASE